MWHSYVDGDALPAVDSVHLGLAPALVLASASLALVMLVLLMGSMTSLEVEALSRLWYHYGGFQRASGADCLLT